MAKQTLEELTRDPMVLALAQADDRQLVNELLAAGFLAASLTTLRGWRTAGRKPPAAIKVATSVRYPVGELRKFVEQALASDMVEPELAQFALPRAQAESGLSSHRGMDLEPVKRGRRKGVKQATFASFLAEGQAEDEWVFAMIPDQSPGKTVRPVDLIETLRLELSDEQLEEATCEQLSLAEYLERLVTYHRDKPDRDRSAEREAALQVMSNQEADSRPPRNRDRS